MEAIEPKQRRCPDCNHLVHEHDYLGCCMRYCRCGLTSLFLIEFFEAE